MKKIIFQKTMTRDVSLATCEAWLQMFANTAKVTKLPWPNPIFIYRNGAVESWRETESFYGTLPKKLLKWVLSSEKNRKLFIDRIKIFFTISKRLKIQAKRRVKFKDPYLVIRQAYDDFKEASVGLALGYWMEAWKEINSKLDYPKEFLVLGKKVRKENTLLDDTNEIIFRALLDLAHEKGFDAGIAKYLTIKELGTIKPSQSQAMANIRVKGFVSYSDKVHPIGELTKFLAANKFHLKNEAIADEKVLRGFPASSGLAKGHVKVVFNRSEANKVKSGDIIIAPMTTPWYVPIMKVAAGFVTDEGGMMCHAAVLARELKKPCIVGTKSATKVFKDGDMVEVDANKGIVRKV